MTNVNDWVNLQVKYYDYAPQTHNFVNTKASWDDPVWVCNGCGEIWQPLCWITAYCIVLG